MISANELPAVDLSPWKEHLLSKGSKDELCWKGQMRWHLLTLSAVALWARLRLQRQRVKSGWRGRERWLLQSCFELTARERNQQCFDRQVSLFSLEPPGEPNSAGRPGTSGLHSMYICWGPIVWVALRSNKKTVFGHQYWCLVSVGSSFADHSLVPHGVDAMPVGKCTVSCC